MDSCSEGHVQVVIINNVPLFFQERDGPWCPTLRVLHQYPDMMKKLRADKVYTASSCQWISVSL
jgi:PUA domain protein